MPSNVNNRNNEVQILNEPNKNQQAATSSLSVKPLHHHVPIVLPKRIETADFLNPYVQDLDEQERKDYVQKGLALLDQSTAQAIDDRLFAHIMGDSFIGGTPLEGNTASSTLSHLIGSLEKINPAPSELPILRRCLAIARERDQLDNDSLPFEEKKKRIHQLGIKLKDQVAQMAVGDSLLIPGGYLSKTSGHAMLYLFCKEADGTLSLEVYNTGDGLQYHRSKAQGDGDVDSLKSKIKYPPVFRFEKIAFDPIKFQHFMQVAIECFNPLPNRAEKDPPYTVEYIYEVLLPILGLTPVSNPVHDANLITAQNSGVCSEKVLHAFLREAAVRNNRLEEYKEFKLKYKRESLLAYVKPLVRNRELQGLSETQHIQLKKGIQNYALALKKRIEARGQRDGELDADIALLEWLKEAVNRYEKGLDARNQEAKAVQLANSPNRYGRIENAEFAPINRYWKASSGGPSVGTHLVRPSVVVKNPLQSLTEWTAYCEGLLNEPSGTSLATAREVLSFFDRAITQLPMPSGDKSNGIWAGMSKEQIDASIAALDRFSQAAMNAFHRHNELSTLHPYPTHLVAHYRSMAIMLRVAQRVPEYHLENRTLWCYLLKIEKHPRFILTNPEDVRSYEEVLEVLRVDPSKKQIQIKLPPYLDTVNEDAMKSPELEYFSQFIKGTNSPQMILKQIANAISDSQPILPPAISALKRQYLRSDWVMQNAEKKQSGAAGFSCVIMFECTDKGTAYVIKPKISLMGKVYQGKVQEMGWYDYPGVQFQEISFNNYFSPYFLHLKEEKEKPENPLFKLLKEEEKRGEPRLLGGRESENKVIERAVNEKETEEMRDLETLSINSEVLPFNTLSEFERIFTKLSDPAYQEFLMIKLFKPGVLKRYLERYPDFTQDLVDFVKKGLSFYETLNQIDTCLFFARLSDHLADYVRQTLPGQGSAFPNSFPLLSKWFQNAPHGSTKSAIATQIVASFLSRDKIESEDELVGFVQAYAYSQSYPLINGDRNTLVEQQASAAFAKFSPQLIKVNEKLRNRICQSILSAVLDSKAILGWTGEYPLYRAKDEGGIETVIDLLSGRVYHNGLPQGGMPDAIRNNVEFDSLFKGKPYVTQAVDVDVYMIKENEKETEYRTRVVYKEGLRYMGEDHGGASVNIQRKFGNQWCQLISKEKVDKALSCNELTRPGYRAWVTENLDWIYITNKQGKVKCTIRLTNDLNYRSMLSVTFVTKCATEKSEELQLVDTVHDDNHPYKLLERLEDKQWISVWKNADNSKQFIKLWRYGLNFKVEAGSQPKAWSKEFPGYYWVPGAKLDALRPFDTYLILENGKGQRKVLIPRQELTQIVNENDPLSVRTRSPEKTDKIKREYFDIDLDGAGNPKSNSIEKSLYLVYIALCQARNPDMAAKALAELAAVRTTRPYHPEEIEIMQWILRSKSTTTMRDPEANAVKLKLGYFMLVNKQLMKEELTEKDEEEQKGLLKNLSELLVYYLKSEQNNGLVRLAKHEAELIAKEIGKMIGLSEKLQRLLAAREHPERAIASGKPMPLQEKALDSTAGIVYYLNELQQQTRCDPAHLSDREKLGEMPVSACPGEFFQHYLTFLHIALYGTEPEKLALAYRLRLMVLKKDARTETEVKNLLQAILVHPDAFKEVQFPKQAYDLDKLFDQLGKCAVWAVATQPEAYAPLTFDAKRIVQSLNEEARRQVKRPERSNQPLQLKAALTPVKDVQGYIQVTPKENAGEEASPIQLTVNTSDPVIKAYLADTQKDIEAYEKQKSNKQIGIQNLERLRTELQAKIATQNAKLENERNLILKFANRLPVDKADRCMHRLGLLGRNNKPITIEVLLGLYLQGNPEGFRKANPSLNDQDVSYLMQLISHHLVRVTCQNQRLRCLEWVESIAKLNPASGEYESEKRQLSAKLAQELMAQRQYTEQTKPERIRAFQVFEYLSNMQIRSKQMEIIQNILDGKVNGKEREFIAQLIMGGGKSRLILPIVAMLLADGTNLPLMLVPKALVETQKEYMTLLSGRLFDQEANTLSFDRDTAFTVESLTEIHDTLVRVRKNREYIIMTPETLQAMELRYVEGRKLINSDERIDDPDFEKKILIMGDILRLFRQHAVGVLDEADTILNILYELNFVVGSGESIPAEHLRFNTEIYQMLTLDPEIKDLIGLCEGQQVSRSKKNYESKVKGLLADRFAGRFCKNDSEKELFKKYVLCDKTLKEVPPFIQKMDAMQRELIDLLRDQLNTYLPLTLSRNGYQNYTFSKKTSVEFAIPALNSKPSENSQFGNHYEAINYTLQMGLQAGIPERIIERVVNGLRQEAYLEMKKGVALRDTQAYQRFAAFYPKKGLFAVTPADWTLIVHHINGDRMLLLSFIEKCLLPKIAIYPTKMSSDAFRLVSMLHRVYGFAGTASWNKRTFHPRVSDVLIEEGTDGLTIDLLLRKEQQEIKKGNDPIHYIPSLSNEEKTKEEQAQALVDQIFEESKKVKGGFQTIIDLGALFKGVEDFVPQAILTQPEGPGMSGVVFFDKETNELLIQERGWKKPKPFEQSSLEPHQRFTFYDEPHTIGAHIVQKFDGRAAITVGENLLLSGLMQGSWRMRGLDLEQSVHFIIPRHCQLLINKVLERDESTPITFIDIVIFSAINQAHRQGDDLEKSTKKRVANEVRDITLESTLKLEVNAPTEAQELFSTLDADGIFATANLMRPNSGIDEKKDTPEVLQQYKDYWLKTVSDRIKAKLAQKNISPILAAELQQALNLIQESIQAIQIPEVGRVTPQVTAKAREDLGTEVEAQKHVNQEAQQRIQLELQSSEENKEKRYANRVLPWIFTQGSDVDQIKASQAHASYLYQQELAQLKMGCPFYFLENVMDTDKGLGAFASLFQSKDVKVLFTENFHPYSQRIGEAKFFDRYQKPLNHLFINANDKGNEISVTMISEDDLEAIEKRMRETRGQARGGVQWIYDMRRNKIQLSTKAREAAQFQNDPRLQRMLVLLRLFNAETDYTEEQQKVLLDIIKKMGSEAFMKLFSRIAHHRDSLRTFDGSVLQRVVDRVMRIEGKDFALSQNYKNNERLAALRNQRFGMLKPKSLFQRIIDFIIGLFWPDKIARKEKSFLDHLIAINQAIAAAIRGAFTTMFSLKGRVRKV